MVFVFFLPVEIVEFDVDLKLDTSEVTVVL